MAKRNSLTSALKLAADPQSATVAGPSETSARPQGRRPVGAQAPSTKPGRTGLVNVTGYFHPDVKKSIRLIQAYDPNLDQQDILALALNDFFAKHNVPQTALLTLHSDAEQPGEPERSI